MIKLSNLLPEAVGKRFVDTLLNELQPTIDKMVEASIKALEKKDPEFNATKLDREYIELGIIYDMLSALERYTKPTDKLISVSASGSSSGSMTINVVLERDGVQETLRTEVIFAGGYNIQRLHYRYLVKTSLPKNNATPEADAVKDKIKRMTKLQKYQAEIDELEKRIEAAEAKLAIANSMKSDDDIKKYIFSHPEESKKIYHHTIDNPQEFEKFYGQDDDWKERWMKRYRDWPTRDIENLKTAVAKLQAKIDKETK
jgi:polyhydroxyalkanoate synthesis regulator phasin